MKRELIKFFEENRVPMVIPYRPCADAHSILHKSQLPFLPILGFTPPVEQMLKEAIKLIPMMVSHRAEYEEHSGWKSLVLHGLGPTMTSGAEHYGLNPDDPSIYKWTEVAELAPVTTAFFRDTFKYNYYQRIRFMLLEPGGYVCPHTDSDQYLLGSVNIALNNPAGCEFAMKGVGVLPFEPGAIIKLALINQHAVINRSTEPRIHMIIHGSPDHIFWNPLYLQSYQQLITNKRFAIVEN